MVTLQVPPGARAVRQVVLLMTQSCTSPLSAGTSEPVGIAPRLVKVTVLSALWPMTTKPESTAGRSTDRSTCTALPLSDAAPPSPANPFTTSHPAKEPDVV